MIRCSGPGNFSQVGAAWLAQWQGLLLESDRPGFDPPLSSAAGGGGGGGGGKRGEVSGPRYFYFYLFIFFFFFFAFPSYISGVHHFWVRFLRM